MDVGSIYLIVAIGLLLLSAFRDIEKTKKALKVTGRVALTVLPVLFMIFILMGVIEAFVSKEVIAQWLGSGSSVLSIVIGEIVGCVALIEPAAVFPFGGFLHKSGANYGTIVGFVMTAILIGIATFPLEMKLFGKRFTIVRNILTFVIVFIIGIIFKVVHL